MKSTESTVKLVFKLYILFVCFSKVTAKAAESFKCGKIRCKRRGYDFCVGPPDIDEGENPFCLSCKSKQNLCGTSDEMPECEPYCAEFLRQDLIEKCKNLTTHRQGVEPSTESNTIYIRINRDVFIAICVCIAFVSICPSAVLLVVHGSPFVYYLCHLLKQRRKVGNSGALPPERVPLKEPLEVVIGIDPLDGEGKDETSVKSTDDEERRSDVSEDTTNVVDEESKSELKKMNINPCNDNCVGNVPVVPTGRPTSNV